MAKPKLALIPSTVGGSVYSVLPSNGDGDFDFSRASAATRINAQGLIETVAATDNRLNYPLLDGTVQTCPHLLLEGQRTNLITQSESFDNAAWVKNNLTVTSNAAISPDGTLNADLLNFTLSGNYIDYAGTITIGQSYTVSCYVKSAVSSNQTFNIYGNANKVAAFAATSEWQRFTHTFTADITAMSSGINSTALNQLYVWGFQLEEGSYSTSYIVSNSGSATTRIAEVCDGSGNASTFNDSEGVLMVQAGFVDDTSFKGISISSGVNANSIRMYSSLVDNQLVFRVRVNDVDQVLKLITLSNTSISNKISIKYKENDFSIFVNGFKLETATSGITYPAETLNQLNFNRSDGNDPFYGKTKQIGYYNTILTDLELETLTSYRSWESMVNELNLNIIYNG